MCARAGEPLRSDPLTSVAAESESARTEPSGRPRSGAGEATMRTFALGVVLLLFATQIVSSETRAETPGLPQDAGFVAHRQLSWSDFQGQPIRNQPVGLPGALLVSAEMEIAIKLEPFEIELRNRGPGMWVAQPDDLCVWAVMSPARSRAHPDHQTDRVLAHEQGHFDITEYFVRRLRARLADLEYQGRNPTEASQGVRGFVERESREIATEWREMEQRYERETLYGINRRAQRRWLQEIDRMLNSGEPLVRLEGSAGSPREAGRIRSADRPDALAASSVGPLQIRRMASSRATSTRASLGRPAEGAGDTR